MSWQLFWLAVGSVAALVGTIVAATVAIGRRFQRIDEQNRQQLTKQDEAKRRDDDFREDWYGRPARPGVPSEPGVMERLANIEHNTASLPERLRLVEQRLDDHIRTHPLPPTAGQ